jgi:outer membrane receptor protein involved in Fe transport
VVDHSNGALVVAGSTTRFQPDVFRETSKIRWGVQPALHLDPWLNENVTIKANIYHRTKGQWGTADSNTSLVAGNIQPRNSVFGLVTDPGIMPGYTLSDLRIDWRNIRGSRVSGALSVTNLTDKTVMVGGSGGLTLAGITPGIANEPRMWFLELNYEFGN